MKKNILYLFVLMFLPNYSYADEWYNTLLATCDKDKDEFKINYYGAYNEAGIKMEKEVNSKTQNTCELSDGKYELKPRIFLGSQNGMGRCGSFEYVEITVIHNEKIIFSHLVLEDCHYSKEYISSVLIMPNFPIKVERSFEPPSY
mgnify:CR=1 FL=1